MKIFSAKILEYFKSLAQNIDCEYRGGSNEYPESMFWVKNKKK